MSRNPSEVIANSPMSRMQVAAVSMCVLLIAIDGFDVLSISFAAPGIADEWGINRAALGVVLSMELIGMAVGSVLLGNFADVIGRRPTILMCLFVMSSGMFLASIADSVPTLSAFRFYTGLGIGGMLAAVNAIVAEFSSTRHRNLAVTMMAAGFPLGAIVGGSIASMLLISFDWRSVFIFGAIATVTFFPLVWVLLPESVEFLLHGRPDNALERINLTLKRIGHPPVTELPAPAAEAKRASTAQLFTAEFAPTTLLLTLSYFAHIMTFYFILKWIPKIVVEMGYAASAAGGVLVWANVGGVSGAVLLGLLTRRFDVRPLVIAALLCSAVAVGVFGRGPSDLPQLSLIAAAAGFFTNSAIVGLYAIFAQAFPTRVRAGGTGFVIGVGRGGAALGPIIAGVLFAAGHGLAIVAAGMAFGSLIAALMLKMVPYEVGARPRQRG